MNISRYRASSQRERYERAFRNLEYGAEIDPDLEGGEGVMLRGMLWHGSISNAWTNNSEDCLYGHLGELWDDDWD